jgi:apolipoprotein N-acyltransferase
MPLLIAVVLLPFANGGQSIGLAAWLAPLFLLRFTRTHRRIVALPLILIVQAAAFAFQFRGMIPFSAPIQMAVVLTYASAFAMPYIGDHLSIQRLSGFSRSLVFPILWTAIEFLLSFGPFGSWCATAYSQEENLALLQVLAITGLGGVTFLIGWAAAAGNAFWEKGAAGPVPRVTIACAMLVIAVLLAGGVRLARFAPSAKTVRVASLSALDRALHPDHDVVRRFDHHEPLTAEEVKAIRESTAAIADDLLLRTEREARAGARIVFWGEGNALVLKDDEDDLIRRGGMIAKRDGIYLGMALASWHLETTPHMENKIVLIQPDGTPAWEFFKAHPVPGREAAISIKGDGKMRAIDTQHGRLSAAICFDADFPRLLAQGGRLRADIVLDPSNDWKAIDPWHTRMASFRAIEQGFNIVRHTSHGLSAAFDYQGRKLASMDHFAAEDHTLVAQVPVRGVRTLYAICGDWFGWTTCLGSLGIVVLGAFKNRMTTAAAD